MMERDARNYPALSPQEGALLAQKTVLVAGCGGLGGYAVELLARLGVGALRCVDGDVFEPTNFNRQILSNQAVLGRSKAVVAGERVSQINSHVRVEAIPEFLTEDNATRLLSGCDAVVDGLDSVAARRTLARACARAWLPLVFGAISGWVAQAGISMPGDGLLDRLYPGDAQGTDKSALSFTPAFCASVQCALCTRLLVGRPVDTGVVYYADLQFDEFVPLRLAAPIQAQHRM